MRIGRIAAAPALALLAVLLVQSPALASLAVASPTLFPSEAEYPVGQGPGSVASADFDGDGIADLAVANAGSSSVSVLLGSGTGDFAPAVDFPVGPSPASIVSADFNDDGNADLATINDHPCCSPSTGEDSVSLLLGDGRGGFAAKTDLAVPGDVATSLVSTDFNGDGNPDLSIVDYASSDIVTLLGTDGGGFEVGTRVPICVPCGEGVGGGLYMQTSADFNGDGNPDLAVASFSSGWLLLGTGTGGFRKDISIPVHGDGGSEIGSALAAIASGDFDGDGNFDLAASTAGDGVRGWGYFQIAMGKGTGAFTPLYGAIQSDEEVAGIGSLITADFDGDGNLDIAYNGGSVIFGDGKGKFGPRTGSDDRAQRAGAVAGTNDGQGSASADFDGDGHPDLAVVRGRYEGGVGRVGVLINAVGPTTIIGRKPKAETETGRKRAKVAVGFSSRDRDASFRCKLDRSSYEPCSSPYVVRVKARRDKAARHEISINASDAAGNVGDPATTRFRVLRR